MCIDPKRQKITDDKIWQEFCKNTLEDIREKRKKLKKIRQEDNLGAKRQLIEGAELALSYWNRCQKSNGEPEYMLVAVVARSPFFDDSGWWKHTTFKARVKDDPAAEPECFFAEIKGNTSAESGQEVTKICILLPTDKGPYDCKACSRFNIRHPASGGFNLGRQMSTIDLNVRKRIRKFQREARFKARQAREQNVCENVMKLKAEELKAKEQSVATRTRSRTRELSVGSTSNN